MKKSLYLSLSIENHSPISDDDIKPKLFYTIFIVSLSYIRSRDQLIIMGAARY